MKTIYRPTVEILQELVQAKSLDYLREGNGRFFVNAFAEMGGDKQDVTLLRYLTQCGGHEDLLDAGGLSPAMQRNYYSQTVRKLCEKTLISEELAHQVCGAFWRAIYNREPPISFRKAEPLPPIPPVPPIPVPPPDPPTPDPLEDVHSDNKPPVNRTKKWPVWVAIGSSLLAVVIALFTISKQETAAPTAVSPQTAAANQEAAVEVDIEGLIAKGTTDIYRFQDGSYIEMYFGDGDKELCRIYKNKNGTAEYVFVATYNEQGDYLSHVTYDGNGNVLRTDLYAYDGNGELTEKCVYLGSSQLKERTTWTYLEDGRDDAMEKRAGDGTLLSKGESTYNANGTEVFKGSKRGGSRWESQYDQQGNLLRYISYDSNGKREIWYEYQYDASGQKTGYVSYGADGTVENRCSYRYDANGREISSEYHNETYGISHKQINTYGPHDVWMGFVSEGEDFTNYYEVVTSIDGTYLKSFTVSDAEYLSYTAYTAYDLMGNMAKYSHYSADTLSSELVYDRDAYGDLVTSTQTYYSSYDGSKYITVMDADGKVISNAHYDAAGNWLSSS